MRPIPATAGRRAGLHERLGSHGENRGGTCKDFSTDTRAREPPAHAAHDRPGAGRRAKSGAGGSRAKLRECSPLTEALLCLPQAAKASAPSARGFAVWVDSSAVARFRRLRPRAASRETSEVNAENSQGMTRRKIVTRTSVRTGDRVTERGGRNRVWMGCTWRVGSGELLVYLAGGFLVIVVYLAGGFLMESSYRFHLFLGLRKPLPSCFRCGRGAAPNILLQNYCKQRAAALKKREIQEQPNERSIISFVGESVPARPSRGRVKSANHVVRPSTIS